MRDVTEFSVGDIIRTSFHVYFSNLPTFIPLSLIAFAPAFAAVLIPDSSSVNSPFVPNTDADPETVISAMVAFLVVTGREGLVGLLCGVWLQAGLAFGVVRHLRGGDPGFVETLVQSVRMLLPATFVALVVGVAWTVGLFLLIVPGVIIALVLWVAVPAAVVERCGLRALGRSAELTNGFKGQIFGLALILILFQLVAAMIAAIMAVALAANAVVEFVIVQSVAVVLSGIWATATSVTYHDLRVLREGVDTRAISRVFE